MNNKEKYSLETVKEVYSYWGKSLFAYKAGVPFFGYESHLRKKAIEALELKKGDAVLDLACGPGIMFSRIEKKIGCEGKLIGIDYVEEMIDQCKKLVKRKKWKNVTLIREDAAKMKLKPSSIDAIISVIGLSAIPEHKKAIKKCCAFLKKGGRMVILDGKDFKHQFRFLNPLLKLIRWSKSYEQKDLIKDIKKVFGHIQVKEHVLGSIFIAVAVKK